MRRWALGLPPPEPPMVQPHYKPGDPYRVWIWAVSLRKGYCLNPNVARQSLLICRVRRLQYRKSKRVISLFIPFGDGFKENRIQPH